MQILRKRGQMKHLGNVVKIDGAKEKQIIGERG